MFRFFEIMCTQGQHTYIYIVLVIALSGKVEFQFSPMYLYLLRYKNDQQMHH